MRKLLLLPIALFALASCESGEVESSSTAHIYAVGNCSTSGGGHEAYITKDGVSSSLGADYYVADLFVQGNDVYTSGNKDNVGVYTKNGVFNALGAGSSVNNIYVDGTDIYLSGKMGDSPAYWKNGVITTLDFASGFKGVAYDITVSNGDVYVAGYECDFIYPNPTTNILYWKNGVLTRVNSTHNFSFNWIGEISLAVDNDDVYLAVNERDHNLPQLNSNAYLIKNGTEEILIDDFSEVHDIFIAGSDIYLCGGNVNPSGTLNKSVIWKNGTVIVEREVNHGAFASIFVVGNNVFAGGVVVNSTEGHATTLINNVFEIVPDFVTAEFSSGYVAVFVTE